MSAHAPLFPFDNSYARLPERFFAQVMPTPVAEADRVWVHFGAYGTACLDAADGRVIWRSEPLDFDHEHGPGSSPILYRDLLIVNFDGAVPALSARLITGPTPNRPQDWGNTRRSKIETFFSPLLPGPEAWKGTTIRRMFEAPHASKGITGWKRNS